MKKVLLLALILMTLVVFFAACDNSTPPAVTDPPVTNVPEVTEPEETTDSVPDPSKPETNESGHTHTWSDWIVIKEAKCEEDGLDQRYCTICNYTESLPIAATGHTEVTDNAVGPTCTQAGLTEGKHCSVCSKTLTTQEIVPALGHAPGPGATCTTTQHCTVCGDTIAAANGHAYVADITPPTATGDGNAIYTCSVCGDTYSEVITPEPFTITNQNRKQIGYTGETGENLVIPSVFKANDNTWYRVTKISNLAFYECTGLTSIVIPDSVTFIGGYAFQKCTSLTSITIPESVTCIEKYLFLDCASLTSIVIPDSVNFIGYGAFSGCSSLESITLPFVGESEKKAYDTYQYPFGYIFGAGAYTGGVATKQYYYGSNTSNTTSWTFYIPASLESVTITGGNILYGAFYNCSGLASIVIHDSVTRIRNSGFYGCRSLIYVEIPNSVTNIEEYAFGGCSRLTSITFEGNMKQWESITKGDNWRKGVPATEVICSNGVVELEKLTSKDFEFMPNGDGTCYIRGIGTSVSMDIVIPKYSPTGDKVTGIDDYAFSGCTRLTSIVIPDGLTSIGDYAFNGCTRLTSIVIPDSVTSIGKNAFCGCADLTSIVIPDGVTSIRSGAFYNCADLTSIVIPDGLTSIGVDAFNGCTRLTSIVIPDSVTSIGENAFRDCSRLSAIYFSGTLNQWLNCANLQYTNIIITVYCNGVLFPYVNDYKTARNWSYDTFFVNGEMYFLHDGNAADKLGKQNNTIEFVAGQTHDSISLRGWIGFDQPIAQFGYFIDDVEFIYSEDFWQGTEDAVLNSGGDYASRFKIDVPLLELEAGSHKVGFVVKVKDGTVILMHTVLTIIIQDSNG